MNYKVVKRTQPGVTGGGDAKYYASPLYSGKTNLRSLGMKLSNGSTLTKTDTMAVLIGLVDMIAEELKEGKIVELGGLGTFRISINSAGEETVEQVTSNSIKKTKVIFRPGAEFKESLTGLNFSKGKDVTVNPEEESTFDTETAA